ncbi:MAG: TIR domain-containing protein [Rubrivivax sp.]
MIFISYRRVDAQAWASHLYTALRTRFGEQQVFMDVRQNGLQGGDLFADVLRQRLQASTVVLAVVGPQWETCTRADGPQAGLRRLHCDDDWVREEVRHGLQAGALVVPVLFGRSGLPDASTLPADLQPLLAHHHQPIDDNRWDADFQALVTTIARVLPTDDVAQAGAGLQGLRALMQAQPAVAQAVGASRLVLERSAQQITRLQAHKAVHDELHTIEHDCLAPLRAWQPVPGGPLPRVRPLRLCFHQAAARVAQTLEGQAISAGLRDDIRDQMALTGEALQRAVEQPSADTLDAALEELERLIGHLPARLDTGITEAATELRLGELLDLMATICHPLASTRPQHAELAPLLQGQQALDRLRQELDARVAEHGKLQRLDAQLRTACGGRLAAARWPGEWARLQRLRKAFGPAVAVGLQAVEDDLLALEAEVNALPPDDTQWPALMDEYFRCVAQAFRQVDTELKTFCLRLSDVGQPLLTVLNMV